jgi:AcrR family transcriptional regulator
VPRTKQRTAELRERVLSVALERLDREGVAGLTARAVAGEAGTSTPAVYELFGDKWGLVGEVYFEGFRLLRGYLEEVRDSGDPRRDLVELARVYRRFWADNPGLAAVMFSRPFTDFDPGPTEKEASGSVRIFIVEAVERAMAAGQLGGSGRGRATDMAHVFVALIQGLAAAETARRLGTTRASIDRRFELAVAAVLDGLGP